MKEIIVDREQLISDHLEWAQELGRNYSKMRLPKSVDPEWVAGVAVAGLYDAATKWKPELIAFKSYGSRRIKGHIRDELRKLPLFFNKNKKDHPTAIPISQIVDNSTEEEGTFDIADMRCFNPSRNIQFEELRLIIEKKARKELVGTSRDWVICCVLGDLTQKELASHLNLSEGRIAQVKKDPAIIKFFNEIKLELFSEP